MSTVDVSELAKIDALQARYVGALDSKNLKAWLDTFSERDDVSYTCTTAESVKAGLPMALMMDDNRRRLEDRITFVDSIWKGIFADYQSRHFVQRTEWNSCDDGLIEVKSNYLVVNTLSETGRTMIFSAGTYVDRVELGNQDARFRSKTVIMDTVNVERHMAYPI